MKHRVIQDLRRNEVNACVTLPELQVLPRPADHATDLAKLSAVCSKSEEVRCLVLDFKDAFITENDF